VRFLVRGDDDRFACAANRRRRVDAAKGDPVSGFKTGLRQSNRELSSSRFLMPFTVSVRLCQCYFGLQCADVLTRPGQMNEPSRRVDEVRFGDRVQRRQ